MTMTMPTTTCSIDENNFPAQKVADPLEGHDDYGRGLYLIVSYLVCTGSCVVLALYLTYYGVPVD